MIAIFYALKSEIKYFKLKLLKKKQYKIKKIVFYEGEIEDIPVLLVQTGIGMKKAKIATEIALKKFDISLIISTGFAGALQDKIDVGDLVNANDILYVKNLEECKDSDLTIDSRLEHKNVYETKIKKVCQDINILIHSGDSLTVNKIVFSAATKSWLGANTNAISVDMETFAIAEIALDNSVPFLSIRSISDNVHSDLDIENITDSLENGEFDLRKTSWEIIKDIKTVPHLMKLRKQTVTASRKIARFLFCFIQTIDKKTLVRT